MNESKTPKVDGQAAHLYGSSRDWFNVAEEMTAFARALELELNAANKQIEMDTVRFKEMQEAGLRHEVELNEALKWKNEDPRMLREQIKVADNAFNGLTERYNKLESKLTTAQQEIAELRKLVTQHRQGVATFLVPWRSQLDESWLKHFVKECGVEFDAIGFVSATPLKGTKE